MIAWELKDGETPIDPSRLVDKSIRNRADLDRAEATNILKAAEKYATAKLGGKRAFTYEWLLRVHRDMFCDVWVFAGEVRTIELSLGIAPHLIGQQLGGLALDIAAWKANESLLLEQAVTIHHRAVHIHPFENGNGRWARFVANLWLRKHGKPMVEWPEPKMSATSDVRDEYLAAIRRADQFDYGPLVALHDRFWSVS